MQAYSDPKRASEPGALPDVEVFYVNATDERTGRNPLCPLCTETPITGYRRQQHEIHNAEHVGWYWQRTGTTYNDDGSCHPDCGPIVLDAYDIRGKAPMLSETGEHAHENEDGRCWHESYNEPNGPFATEAEALADAQSGTVDDEPRADGRYDDSGDAVGMATDPDGIDDELPPCVRAMHCYCAGHARGNPASAPCDTTE